MRLPLACVLSSRSRSPGGAAADPTMLKGPYLQDLAPLVDHGDVAARDAGAREAVGRGAGRRAHAGGRGRADRRGHDRRARSRRAATATGRGRRRARGPASSRPRRRVGTDVAVLVRRVRRHPLRHRAASPRDRADVARRSPTSCSAPVTWSTRASARTSGSSSSTSRTGCCATTSTSRRSATTTARAAAAPPIRYRAYFSVPENGGDTERYYAFTYGELAVPRPRLERVQLRAHRSDRVDRARADRRAPGSAIQPRLRRDAPPAVLDLAARRPARSARALDAAVREVRRHRGVLRATTTSTSAPSTTACATSSPAAAARRCIRAGRARTRSTSRR